MVEDLDLRNTRAYKNRGLEGVTRAIQRLDKLAFDTSRMKIFSRKFKHIDWSSDDAKRGIASAIQK